MAQQEKAREYSHLELLKHDATAHGPERDRFAEASELDQSVTAPEVSNFVLLFTTLTLARGFLKAGFISIIRMGIQYLLGIGLRKNYCRASLAKTLGGAF